MAERPHLMRLGTRFAVLAEEFKEVYLVVDALDECEEALREQILDAVVEFSSNYQCAKAFIANRPENDIQLMFRHLRAPAVCIKARNTAEDIRKYVTDSVASLTAANKLRLQNQDLKFTIIECLVEKADGMCVESSFVRLT